MDSPCKRMAEDMKARGFPPETIKRYLGHVERFEEHSIFRLAKRPPGHIRAYQVHLLVEEKAAWDTVADVVSALKFLYEVTLRKPGHVQELSLLRRRMIDDMRIRNYSPNTIRNNVRRVELFAKHFGRSPEQLGPEDIRAFQVDLIESKASPGVLNQFVAALRFFYSVTFKQPWAIESIPYSKQPKKLPEIPAREVVLKFLEGVPNLKHRAILTTCYGAGVRISEVTHLKVTDIDSARMILHVHQGKGRKDRIIPLSEALLRLLREYWRVVMPKTWLFPGARTGRPISSRSVARVCKRACERSGIKKKLTVHTLRHAFATHLLDAGTNIRAIQLILGHSSLQSTGIYIHLSTRALLATMSPLDLAPTTTAPEPLK